MDILQSLRQNIARVMVGKDHAITSLLVALVADGHVLLEDVPGTGKTVLAKSLSRSLDLSFKRMQFTPDLLPSDVTGINFYNQKQGLFEFRPGPAFTHILLADEINRATPRTQSALLECMEERQITVDGETRTLASPFLVIATQNPVELEGTFPLPEAQLDRFLLCLELGYPSVAEEQQMINRFKADNPLDALESVAGIADVIELRKQAAAVYISDSVANYLVAVVRATREVGDLRLGASPRGSLALMKAARALAVVEGRSYVLPDDVKRMAVSVLAHRLILRNQARFKGHTPHSIIHAILDQLPVPVLEE